MAQCPFAIWRWDGRPQLSYVGGPFKIVHHTTESSSESGSVGELHWKHVESHFVVDDTRIIQLLDTDKAARALRNEWGGVQTNRDSAIQIELVGFAGKPKSKASLANVRRLCRWLEDHHGIPRVWPNGYPNPPKNGKDPGHHNRNAHNWDTMGGHYGHSQVPENIHWDPAYTKEETDFVMSDIPPESVA